ncbi:MAG: ABC transporter permease subunit [Pirellulaceae bacterium]|nr:ABC transporter permease subunit [Pirellulaceae bacterium]
MNRALIRKSIREGLVVFLACAAGLFSFCIFRVWIVGRFDSARFKQIIDLLPRDWDRFASVEFSWLVSYLGRVVMTFDEPMVLMLVALWGIVRGSDVVSGELGRGTMEMLLAQPVTRRAVFWSPVIVSLIGAVLLALVIWIAMWIGVQITSIKETVYPSFQIPFGPKVPMTFMEPREEIVRMKDVIDPLIFWPGIINTISIGVFFVAFTSWLSALDRYRWRTLGIVVGMFFAMGMLKVGGLAVDSLRWMLYLTVFSLYEPDLHIRILDGGTESLWSVVRWNSKFEMYELGALGSNLLLLLLAAAFLIHASRVFERRDLEAPV